MRILKSIEALERQNILETACKPVLVFCNDLEHYYCKYNTGFSSADTLLREYLCASFLKEWDLLTPDFAFVIIQKEHVTEELGVPYRYFSSTCFGSKKLNDATEVNRFFSQANAYQKSKFNEITDYLKISLFDIWVANDDRNHNNYNLLVTSIGGKYRFAPIDHEKCFNTGNLRMGLYTITEESSILTAPLCFNLFTARELSNHKRITGLKDYFYLCIVNCHQELENILKNIPSDWNLNVGNLRNDLETKLFNLEWLKECWDTFIRYLQYTTNKLSSNNTNNGNLL